MEWCDRMFVSQQRTGERERDRDRERGKREGYLEREIEPPRESASKQIRIPEIALVSRSSSCSAAHSPHEMAERPSKLARIQRLRDRLPHVSQSALASILAIAANEELPTGSRKDIREGRNAAAQEGTPYGPLHQELQLKALDGTCLHKELQHPAAMLFRVCETSEAFRHLVAKAALVSPPSLANPWRIVLYMDEVLPGNQLAYSHERKMWAVYWSVLEFGSAALSDEDLQKPRHSQGTHSGIVLMFSGGCSVNPNLHARSGAL